MALGSVALLGNVKRSLDKYTFDNLYTTEGYSVDWEGLKFEESAVTGWIQPRIVDISSEYVRQASATEYGEQANVLFQINIFTKKSGVTISHRHYLMRDAVANYFKIGQSINLKDYTSAASPTVATMKVRDIVTDSPFPETATLYGWTFAVEIDYTRTTTKV